MTRLPLVVAAAAALALGAGFYVASEEPEAAHPVETAFAPAFHGPLAFEDPAGDATDTGTGSLTHRAGCWVGEAVAGECVEAVRAAPALGTPGPYVDLVGVAVEAETQDEVVLSVEVSELSEGFPELRRPDGTHRMTSYSVCVAAAADRGCDRAASLMVMLHDGEPHTEARFDVRSRDCNDWSWCAWTIPADVAFGAPAKITFRVPKAYLAFDGAPAAVDRVAASTTWYEEAQAFPMWHPGVTAHTPAYHFHTHGTGVGVFGFPDVTDEFAVGAALVAAPMPRAAEDAPVLPGSPGNNHGGGSPFDKPELDILGFDLHEDAGDLVAVFALAEYRGTPAYDFDYSVAVGVEENVWEIGYRHEGGKAYGYAGRCVMEPCQDPELMDPEVEIVEGAPAFLSVRVPLEFLKNPEPGTPTNLLWAMSMYSDVNAYWGDHHDDAYGDYHSVFMVDAYYGGEPYVFGSGHRASFEPIAGAGHH